MNAENSAGHGNGENRDGEHRGVLDEVEGLGAFSLTRWITMRITGFAFFTIIVTSLFGWFHYSSWEASVRGAMPVQVREELVRLEALQEENPDQPIPRLREIYGQYLFGEYFSPRLLKEDILFGVIAHLFVIVSVALYSVWVSRRMSRQLEAVIVAADQVSEGNFSARTAIMDDAPPGLRLFAEGFNEMVTRLGGYDSELQASSAAIAHELRTPLTAAKARLQGVMDGVLPMSAENLGMIMGQLDQLNHLVTDLYLLSLASAGELALEKEDFDMSTLVRERVSWAEPRLLAAGMAVDVQVPPQLPVCADHDRIGQVLSILIDNAIQYGAAGRKLCVSLARQEDRVAITVRDHGAGFPEALISRVCERFWRAEGSRSRNKGGAGLGMSVAAAICAAHGGELALGNHAEGGAVVTVLLPGAGA